MLLVRESSPCIFPCNSSALLEFSLPIYSDNGIGSVELSTQELAVKEANTGLMTISRQRLWSLETSTWSINLLCRLYLSTSAEISFRY